MGKTAEIRLAGVRERNKPVFSSPGSFETGSYTWSQMQIPETGFTRNDPNDMNEPIIDLPLNVVQGSVLGQRRPSQFCRQEIRLS